MEATWVNENGESEFCGLMPPSDGYIRLSVNDNLRFDMSGAEAHSLLNQIGYPQIEDDFDDGSVQYIDEGDYKTIFFKRTCFGLTAIQVEFLQSELERVLNMVPN